MPILTLTSDIGQRDFLVGAIKGQLLSVIPNLQVVDITHYLSKTNFPLAAYTCSNAFRYYPPGTVHLMLVNLFENSPKHFLICKYKDQFLACPDNGLLTMITGVKPNEMVAISLEQHQTLLEITQELAFKLAELLEENSLKSIGLPIQDIEEKYPLKASIGADWIDAQILLIDQFENVVVNITREEFNRVRNGRNFKIEFTRNESIHSISENYASVAETDTLAWFNSAGYLELAIRNGNMAGLFGLQGYQEQLPHSSPTASNKWFYQTVRVFFE